jgi:hypothetical protein
VLGYAYKERSEFCPAGVWTLDKLPDWAQSAFLKVTLECGAWYRRGSVRPRRRTNVIEMPKRPSWREKIAERTAA